MRSPFAPLFGSQPPGPKPLSVAELAARLQSQVQLLGSVVVEGEVSGLRGGGAGHLYFALKDPRIDASISCVMFRRDAQVGGGERIVEGLRVVVRVTPEVYTARGQLQLVVQKVEATAEGDLAARREALKRKLDAEGLFDRARKRPLPEDPQTVGVVTSGNGAAFADIVKVARARGRVRILLAHAQVQGEAAPRDLVRALGMLAKVREVSVIILGRGGGSAEDLAAFDDEGLARAIAACPKPVVAAVGHEVDWSIACLVADARAATPSHAAELVVPDLLPRRRRLKDLAHRLLAAMRTRLAEPETALARMEARVRAPERALRQHAQRLDELEQRLRGPVTARLGRDSRALVELDRRLSARDPRRVLDAARGEIEPLSIRLSSAMRRALDRHAHLLSASAQRLDAISPLAVLARGYAIALHDGAAVREARELAEGDSLEVRLHEGSVDAVVRKVRP